MMMLPPDRFNSRTIMLLVIALGLSGRSDMATSLHAVDSNLEPMDCLSGRQHCLGDITCKRQFHALGSVCDQQGLLENRREGLQQTGGHCHNCTYTEEVCREEAVPQCADILSYLQSTMYFHRCTCHARESDDVVLCQNVHKRVHQHPCSMDPDYDYKDDYEDERADGCTRVRKRCLQDDRCQKVINTYRIKCSESKRHNKCTSLDRLGCFDAIQKMESLIPDLFTCGCQQRATYARTRCRRIQSRLANNTCRVEVPYYIHSRQAQDTTFDTLISIVQESSTMEAKHKEKQFQGISIVGKNTCPQAFAECNKDSSCQHQMANFMTACVWRKTNTCDRRACLEGIKDFFLYIKPRHAQNLLFCQCKTGDEQCEALKRALYPTCSLVQMPPPSCLDIMARCKEDSDCSMRYEVYETNCGFHRGDTLCPKGPSMCRTAMLGIMGTILTTNCTCALNDPDQNQLCLDTRRRFQGYSDCKRDAIERFHMESDVTQVYMDSSTASRKEDCLRLLSENFPNYYETPLIIRKYENSSTCSELCSCFHNGTLLCRLVPCRPNLSCKYHGLVYGHGTDFSSMSQHHCQCIHGESVCALDGHSATITQPGLFLHVGISLGDKNLLEEIYDFTVDKHSVTRKLNIILNSGTQEHQACLLRLYQASVGHLVLKLEVSPHSHNQEAMQSCVLSAKKLAYKVNDRNLVISKDAELSVIKVAQLQNVSDGQNTIADSGEIKVYPGDVIPYSFSATPAGQATYNSACSSRSCHLLFQYLVVAVVLQFSRLWCDYVDLFRLLTTKTYTRKTCDYG